MVRAGGALQATGGYVTAVAESASGTVRAVVGPNLRPGNIWETFELPALRQNPKVDKTMTVDPSTGKEKLVWSRK